MSILTRRTFRPARKPEFKFANGLSIAQRDAVVAALRLLAVSLLDKAVEPNDGDIGDILTNSGEHPGLSADQITEMADQILGE